MKKSTLLLALLVLSPALYARTEKPFFTREQVLDVFARFNPSVLEQAQHREDYKAILDYFLATYHREISPATEAELIAAARNFDTSIKLDALTNVYQRTWRWAHMSGSDIQSARRMFVDDLSDEMARIWAVTVQVRQYQLDQVRAQLAWARKNEPEKTGQLQQEMDALKAEIKALKHSPGQYVTSAVEDYVTRTERQLTEEMFSVKQQAAQESARQACASSNLQIKSKNKKPVAK